MIKYQELKKYLPTTPGVYLMRSKNGTILYVGKAANLRRRVMSYFERPQERRIERMLELVVKVDIKKTNSVIEALMLEAQLIKANQPQYNILEKDDKSFLHVVFTREKFPRVVVCREAEAVSYHNPLANFGPFTSGGAVKAALKVLRRIFPWSEHLEVKSKKLKVKREERGAEKPCFNYSIGLCPGTCVGAITPAQYRRNIRQLRMIFRGKSGALMRALEKEMRTFSKQLRFEEAAEIKRKLNAFAHINDVALLKREEVSIGDSDFSRVEGLVFHRVEGYDISNIGGAFAVGSMVVFTNGAPDPKEYRKFRIRTVTGQNDVAMLREVLRRRFVHHMKNLSLRGQPKQSYADGYFKNGGVLWIEPDLILVDGGLPQVNTARAVLRELDLQIPIVGIAKGPERKRNDFFYPPEMHAAVARNRDVLVRVRDSAHKFAIKYHRELRDKI